jgi:erythromycin esterase
VVPKRAELAWIRKQAVPIATVDPAQEHSDLEPLRGMIGQSRIVALGEGTHGTSEFFKMKHRIVRYLAEEMDFTVFAIEANMPEARSVNRYVLTGGGDPKAALSGLYFWTWDTQEVLNMIEWMREFNRSGRGRMEFLGFDMQFPDIAMDQVEDFVKLWEPKYLKEVQSQYAIVREIWESTRGQQDRSAIDFKKWHSAASAVYSHLRERQAEYENSAGNLETDRAVQDANVVVQAAEANMPGKRSRDKSMAENLEWILDHRPLGTKVVIWAHNLHVTRGYDTYRSMGYFLDQKFKEEHMVFGFAFHSGEYTAVGPKGISAYGTSISEPGSVEWFLKQSGLKQFILDLRLADEAQKGSRWLFRELDFRNIGAMASDYAFAPRKVREEYDVLAFFENTTASDCFRARFLNR